MSFWGDERGQAIQIGAVLLFAVLVISFSLYQAYVVPNQNEQIEVNHLQTAERDLIDLRDGIVSVPKTGEGRSVGITLGTNYPARAIALNPPPASGSLRTVGTADEQINVTLSHAQALDGETADYWDGTNRTRATGGVIYEPNYNEFRDPPDIVYDTTTVISRFDDTSLWTTGQTLIDGRQLTLVALDGTYDRSSSRSVSLDVEAVSASTTDVAITNETGENVTIQFASQRNASGWRSLLLEEQQFTNQSGNVVDVAGSSHPDPSYDLVTVGLRGNETYDLRMAKVGVGTGTETETVQYLTDVVGSDTTIQEETTHSVAVQTRDGFNNPVSGVEVYASVESGPQNGTLANTVTTTGENGQAKFQYLADDISGVSSRTVNINVSFEGKPTTSFVPRAPENVSIPVTVENTDGSGLGGDGSGAYTTEWLDPSGQTAIDCPNGPDNVCTFDASQSVTATLTMGTNPIAQEALVEYAVNDTDIVQLARLTGETDATGENQTDVTAINDGFVNVYTSSGSSGDRLVLEVINTVQDLLYNDDAIAVDGPDGDTTPGGVEFTLNNAFSQDIIINEVKINETSGGNIGGLSDEVSPNDEPQRTEVYIEADQNDGWVDVNGGVDLPYQFDMDQDGFNNNGNPRLSSGDDARIHLFEFENNGGNRIDMSGRAFTFTIFFETADGVEYTKQVRVNVA